MTQDEWMKVHAIEVHVKEPVEMALAILLLTLPAFVQSYRPEQGCNPPRSELKRLECGNRADMAKRGFFAEWNRKNAYRFPKQ